MAQYRVSEGQERSPRPPTTLHSQEEDGFEPSPPRSGMQPLVTATPYPVPSDSEGIQAKKKNLLISSTSPITVVPVATANAMLLLGSVHGDNSCYFWLSHFLLLAGVLSLSLSVVGVICSYTVEWILSSSLAPVTRKETRVLKLLQWLSHALTAAQLVIVLLGGIWVLPRIPFVTLDEENDSDQYYCNYSLFVFSAVIFAMENLWLLLGGIALLYISCCNDGEEASSEGNNEYRKPGESSDDRDKK